MTGFGFSSRFKLKKTDEFSSVFNFRRRINGAVLTVHYMPNKLNYARIGIVVGRKTARRAVQRNYMKRVLRELFRHAQPALGGLDLLVRPQKAFTRLEYVTIREDFLQLVDKLRGKAGSEQAK